MSGIRSTRIPELLQKAVYGLCEIHREEIRNARLVANPGCYPTSVLLPLIPLLKAGILSKKMTSSWTARAVSRVQEGA